MDSSSESESSAKGLGSTGTFRARPSHRTDAPLDFSGDLRVSTRLAEPSSVSAHSSSNLRGQHAGNHKAHRDRS